MIDWAEAAPGLFVFCAILAYSRWRFVRFAAEQKASTTLAMIAETLAAIGGVPPKVLADRMGCLKGGVVAGVMIPTPDYVRLASHYGFTADFCHAADPQSKGMVENLCGYAQSDLAVPLLTEAAITGQVVDVPTANTAAMAWCAEVNAAVRSEISAVPNERLVAERQVLRKLPSLRPEIGAASVHRKVDRLSCVRYGSARYSVPTRLVGTTVAVVVDHGALLILEPSTAAPTRNSWAALPSAQNCCSAGVFGLGPREGAGRGPS